MSQHQPFPVFSRLLHWLMAILILAMLFIGIGMVASVTDYHWLVSIHKPLGILILVLAVIRLINRLINPPPALPAEMPVWQRQVALGSHILLYVLMIILPLIGWAMLSAGGYPVTLFGAWHLPSIVPQNVDLFALLRALHTWLAFALFATVLVHLAAALFHGLVRRDGVFSSMARGER